MKLHKQFNVTAIPFNSDILSGVLWELDIEGLTENENSLIIYSSEFSSTSVVMINDLLNSLKEQNLIESFSVEESSLEEKNWNEEWEKSINVIKISDKIVIKPTFRDYTATKEELVITIDPKMSFGTGEHETTKLVLTLLEKYIKNTATVLDVGSGTGILSIAAALLGAEKVIGIDHDQWCLENGIENVELNDVSNIVKIKLGEIDKIDEGPFDLILANINKHILIEIINDLYKQTKIFGNIILSGLLIIDRNDIVELYTNKGFSLIDEKILGEWIALVFTK